MPTDPVVILTREPADNDPLRRILAEKGVRVVVYPCIRTERISPESWQWPPRRSLDEFRVLAFTSRHGVEGFAPAWRGRTRPDLIVAAVGAATARAAEQHLGSVPDVVADPPTGEQLAFQLLECLAVPGADERPGDPRSERLAVPIPAGPVPEPRVLWIRGDRSTESFRQLLDSHGIEVAELVVYRHQTVQLETVSASLPAVLVFASPSAAGNFFRFNGDQWRSAPCVAIGPTTASRLAGLGCRGVVEAPAPDPETLAACIQKSLQELKQHGT